VAARSIFRRVVATGKPERLEAATRSILCVPLVARGRTLGAVYVDLRTVLGKFVETDLAVLETLAAHAATALLACECAAPRAASDDRPIVGVWSLKDVEHEMIARALRAANGNRTAAAKLLGLPKTSLYHRLVKHGLDAG
jgi:transcriptional regulator with GAF, ATPase, and Fis domain